MLTNTSEEVDTADKLITAGAGAAQITVAKDSAHPLQWVHD